MNVAALYPLFLPQLRKAGRWLIRRLVRWGLPRLMVFLQCRIDMFADRRKDTRSKRRKKWLLWRMTWRRRLLNWLDTNKARLTKRAILKLSEAYNSGVERIPWDAANERYGTWSRNHWAA